MRQAFFSNTTQFDQQLKLIEWLNNFNQRYEKGTNADWPYVDTQKGKSDDRGTMGPIEKK